MRSASTTSDVGSVALNGGAGDDPLVAGDRHRIDCGPGVDEVRVTGDSTVAPDCETVVRG